MVRLDPSILNAISKPANPICTINTNLCSAFLFLLLCFDLCSSFFCVSLVGGCGGGGLVASISSSPRFRR